MTKVIKPSFSHGIPVDSKTMVNLYGHKLEPETMIFQEITKEQKEFQLRYDLFKTMTITCEHIDQAHGLFWSIKAKGDEPCSENRVELYGNPKDMERIMKGVEIAVTDIDKDGKEDIVTKIIGMNGRVWYEVYYNRSELVTQEECTKP